MTKHLLTSSAARLWASLFLLAIIGGLMYALTVYAAPNVTLNASPQSSTPGAAVTLSWTASIYDGEVPVCTGTGFSTGGARNGSVTVNPNVTTTYSVNCDGVVKSTTVTISSNPPTASLSANPTSIIYGNSVTISWSSTNATSCSNIVDQYDGQNYATNGATSGSVSITPSTSSNSSRTYTITCTGSGGSAGGSVTVTTQHGVSAQLYVNPSSIQSGNSASLTWASQYSNSCTGTGFSTGGATSGTISVSPTQTTTYSVTCSGNQGSTASDTEVLGVNAPPIGVSCSVNPSPSNVNQQVTWFASAWGGTAPYSFSWIGDMLSSLSGSSVNATYDSAGSKNAIVEVTDTSTSSSSWSSTTYDNQKCTGPEIASDSFTQDGGTAGNQTNVAKSFARSKVNDQSFGPADFHVNPQNYCMQAHVAQSCNPSGNSFGSGGCPFGVDVSLHSGSGRRATVPSDYSTLNGWTVDKYWGAVAYGTQNTGSGQTASYQCSVHTVNADAPDAVLTANPISITEGQTATLTHSCTNSTSASIDQGVGTVTPTVPPGATVAVTPSTTTTYTLTCTGAGGTDTSAVTVSVTAAPTCPAGQIWNGTACVNDPNTPNPPTSCTVDNANPTIGETVTYTASGGSSPYSWTPSGGTGPGGTGNTTTRTYSVEGPYTMQVSGNGSSPINCTVVNAGPVSCGNATASITATPNRVRADNNSGTSLSWPQLTGVDASCSISGPDGYSYALPAPTSCVITGGNTQTPTITKQSVFTLSCDSGEATDDAIVNLIPRFIEF